MWLTKQNNLALIDNLISYYKLDESSGNAVDSMGLYNLTNTNTVGFSAGKINNGADFGSANTNKRFDSTTVYGIDMSTLFTRNFWINVTTAPGVGVTDTPLRWCNNTTASKKGYVELQLFNNAGTQQLHIARTDSAGSDQVGDNYTLTLGTWFMMTYTWDGTNHKLYINGSGSPTLTQASTRTGTNSTSGGVEGVYLGDDGQNSRYYNGLLDEVGTWSRVLTSSEITSLYNSGAGLTHPFSAASSSTATFFIGMPF